MKDLYIGLLHCSKCRI